CRGRRGCTAFRVCVVRRLWTTGNPDRYCPPLGLGAESLVPLATLDCDIDCGLGIAHGDRLPADVTGKLVACARRPNRIPRRFCRTLGARADICRCALVD